MKGIDYLIDCLNRKKDPSWNDYKKLRIKEITESKDSVVSEKVMAISSLDQEIENAKNKFDSISKILNG
jgi:hypothetical protein